MKKVYKIGSAIFVILLITGVILLITKDSDPENVNVTCGTGLKRRSLNEAQAASAVTRASENGVTVNINSQNEITGGTGGEKFWSAFEDPMVSNEGEPYDFLCQCDGEGERSEPFKLKKTTEKFQRVTPSGEDIETCCAVPISEDGSCPQCPYCYSLSDGVCTPKTDASEVTGSCIAHTASPIGACVPPFVSGDPCSDTPNPFRCVSDGSDADVTCAGYFTDIWDGGVTDHLEPSTSQHKFDVCNSVDGCQMEIDWDKWPQTCGNNAGNDWADAIEIYNPSNSNMPDITFEDSDSNRVNAVNECRSICNVNGSCNSFSVKGRAFRTDTGDEFLNGWYCFLHEEQDPSLIRTNNPVGWYTGCFKKN